MLEKSATIKRFEYLPLGIELKKQTKKEWQKSNQVYEFDKKDEDKTKSIDKTFNGKFIRSNLFYSYKINFFKSHNLEKLSNLSFSSKQKALNEIKAKLELVILWRNWRDYIDQWTPSKRQKRQKICVIQNH